MVYGGDCARFAKTCEKHMIRERARAGWIKDCSIERNETMGREKKLKVEGQPKKDLRQENLERGLELIRNSPLFSRLGGAVRVRDSRMIGKGSAAVVTSEGNIILNREYFFSASAVGVCDRPLPASSGFRPFLWRANDGR